MKRHVLLACLNLSLFSPLAYAEENEDCCEFAEADSSVDASFKKTAAGYEFVATTTQTASFHGSNVAPVHQAFLSYLTSKGKVGAKEKISENGMTGIAFPYKANPYDSGNGWITISSDSTLLSNVSTIVYSAISKNIQADGHAKHTKKVKLDIQFKKTSSGIQISISKKVLVEKPFWAPEGAFESGVRDGLNTELAEIISELVEIVSAL